ncbi:MAG: transcription elongation factor GreA [Firmicutes bacterium]|nr:transcription elongation factor GreA [Bacillota bacterium]
MTKSVFLTPQGYKELEAKLDELKVIKRREVAEKIKIAREFGDISENAEYDAAKEEQAMIEGEILEIENKLRTATLIDENRIDTSVVSVGCTVKISDVDLKENYEYKIVGTTEADVSNNRISNESPVGKALLGKKKGVTVDVNTPGGLIKLKIMDIKN